MKAGVVLVAILMALTITAEQSQAVVTCGDVESSLAPCLQYLTGGTSPPPACCTGVKHLKDITPTTGDRQAACKCLKAAATRYSVKPDKARQLPGACGVAFAVPINPGIDCSKIS